MRGCGKRQSLLWDVGSGEKSEQSGAGGERPAPPSSRAVAEASGTGDSTVVRPSTRPQLKRALEQEAAR